MNEMIAKILSAREERNINISKLVNSFDVLSLKANIVGLNKNVFESYFLINYFEKIIDKKIPKYDSKHYYLSSDGPYILYCYQKNIITNLKKKAVDIENNEPLGRFVDLDIYLNSNQSIKRSKMRKCLICDNDAFICNRLKKHSDQELFKVIDDNILAQLSKDIFDAIDLAMDYELKLPYKFGCVCVNDCGSHLDMDYKIMLDAKNAIIPYFIKMFKLSFEESNLDILFNKIRVIGMDAEEAMYQSTNGVNCYKGLIFIMGLIVTSIGYLIKNQYYSKYVLNNIFDNIKTMCRYLHIEVTDKNINKTNGLKAYLESNLKGARHEAINGFYCVLNNYLKLENLDKENLEKCLINIIGDIDDTVMYTRCGSLKKYLKVKEMIKNININGKSFWDELILVNRYCIKENISVGGACDILIVIIFLKIFMEKLTFVEKEYA